MDVEHQATYRSTSLTPVDAGAPVPADREGCVEYLVERLTCPLQVSGDLADSLNEKLQEHWLHQAQLSQVGGEAEVVLWQAGGESGPDVLWSDKESVRSAVHVGLEVFDEEPRVHALNMKTWYRQCRSTFIDRTALLRAPVATPEQYPKHYPRSVTDAELRRDSLKRPGGKPASVFRHGITTAALAQLTRWAEDDHLDALITETQLRVAVDCLGQSVGWTNGKVATFVAIEWSSALVHAYPISALEAAKLPRSNADVLEGLPRPIR